VPDAELGRRFGPSVAVRPRYLLPFTPQQIQTLISADARARARICGSAA
jgi:hypothetical protein